MASIPDKNLSVFREAAITVLDFTESELMDMDALASKLSAIIEAAKKRDEERFKQAH